MSFTSGVASNGFGFYQSTMTNHMKFDLRDNLKLNFDLSYVNWGTMSHQNDLKFSSNQDNTGAVVPAVSLRYNPTDRTTIFIQYETARGIHTQQNNGMNSGFGSWRY
jgi:hypothetical protein